MVSIIGPISFSKLTKMLLKNVSFGLSGLHWVAYLLSNNQWANGHGKQQ